MAEALLFEHEDGRYAVAMGPESPDFALCNPKWHRLGPVDVSALSTNAGEAAEAQPPIELRGVAETLAGQGGDWRSCSGCHELNEGHDTGPYSAVLKCHLGNGCSECGGIGAIWDTTNYAGMAAHALQAAAVHGQSASTEAPSGWLDLQDDPRVNEIVSGLYRRFKDWSQRGFSAEDVTWCEVKADVIRLITATPPAAIPAAPSEHHDALMKLSRFAHTAAGMSEKDMRNKLADIADQLIAIAQPAPVQHHSPYAWAVTALRTPFYGQFAEQDARSEARRVGGDAEAFPLYRAAPVQHNPELLLGWKRYEKLRKLSPAAFNRLHIVNTTGGGAFDDLVDKLPEPSTPVPEAAPVQQEAVGSEFPFYELRFIMRVLGSKGEAPRQDWDTACGMARKVFEAWHSKAVQEVSADPLHRTLCTKPGACSECDRIAALQPTQGERSAS